MIAETIEEIIKEADLKPIEERAIVSRFGLRGETPTRLVERVALFQEDETVKVKTVTREWVRNKEARALVKMRSAMVRLKIDFGTFRDVATEEPYLSLCETLIGFSGFKEGVL